MANGMFKIPILVNKTRDWKIVFCFYPQQFSSKIKLVLWATEFISNLPPSVGKKKKKQSEKTMLSLNDRSGWDLRDCV